MVFEEAIVRGIQELVYQRIEMALKKLGLERPKLRAGKMKVGSLPPIVAEINVDADNEAFQSFRKGEPFHPMEKFLGKRKEVGASSSADPPENMRETPKY